MTTTNSTQQYDMSLQLLHIRMIERRLSGDEVLNIA